MKQKNTEIDFDALEKELYKKHNQLRTNPKSFIPKLKDALNFFKDKIYHRPGEDPIQTYEGPEAINEAISFLQNQKPVGELIYNKSLSAACKDHVNDIGPKGMTTHEGSDGRNLSDRIEKYCEWDGAAAENIDFGFKEADNIILNLLIDDGVPERYQRLNMFHPELKYIGLGSGTHRDYGVCVVIAYARGLRPSGTEPSNVSDFIQEYIKNTMDRKKIQNAFQEDEPDAPDNTVSMKVIKGTKIVEGKLKKITKKIFQLNNGAQHIVEVEDS